MASPSERLSAHFHLRLPVDIAEHFDGRARPTADVFNERVTVDALLDPRSSTVWGGQMLPDTLPFLGNGFGDHLCLRFNADGTLREIIRWCHEGGGWLPCGTSLESSLAYMEARE